MIGRMVRSGLLAGASASRFLFPGRYRYDTVVIELDGDVLEDLSVPGMLRYFMPRRTVFRDLVFTLDDIAADEEVWGVVFVLRDPSVGWAQVQELRDAIGQLRDAGKYTVAFFESAGNLLYYLATACEDIVMVPTGDLAVRGLASEVTFFAEALKKVHVEADFENLGAYKSAAEHFTRRTMSKPHREEVTALLDGLTDQLVRGIAEARRLTPRKVQAHIDTGGFLGDEAARAGLVSAAAYEDELEEYLTEKKGDTPRTIGWSQYVAMRQMLKGPLSAWQATPTLALVYATGPLTMGESGGGAFGRDTAGARSLVEGIRAAREDERMKAIVLRVDSPGGSVLASDLIWREVERAADAKPVVVSFGDHAASGGYYIAAPGHAIFASPGTLTGSIGVIAGKVNLKGLYDYLGIRKDVITRGKMARFESEYGRFTAGERKLLRHQMESAYTTFVDRIASGRKKTRAAVKKVAEGRVWLGSHAVKHGLVDTLGGLLPAIEEAKEKAEIAPAVRPHFAIFPRRRKLWMGAAGLLPLGGMGLGAGFWRGIPRTMRRDVSYFVSIADLTATERLLALQDFHLRIE